MWAAKAQDDKRIELWHFNILGVNVSTDEATIKQAYKGHIVQAHPDRNGSTNNAVVKT